MAAPRLQVVIMKQFVIFMSTQGDDSGSGAQDSPVSSFARAMALARSARLAEGGQAVVVRLAGGRYELDETLKFDENDGGSANAPVTWSSAPGERAVISGGRRIGPWREDVVNGVACLTAEVPAGLGGGFHPLQLFVNGRRADRPRLPKKGWFRVKSAFGKQKASDTPWGSGPEEIEYHDGDLMRFENLEDVRWIGMGAWFEMPMRILEIDEQRRAARLHRQTFSRLIDEKKEWCRYKVDNVREALTEPGEWYFDRKRRHFHYIPRSGETAETIEAFAPALDALVEVRGSRDNPVTNLRFENLTFEHCDWHPPDDFRGSIQAGINVPGAIVFEHAESCILYGCDARRVGGFAVQLGAGSHDCRVVATTMSDLGAGGVRVDHEWLAPHDPIIGDSIVPAMIRDPRPRAATISDCTIHHGGRVHWGAVGILVGNAGFCRILHNHVHDMRYSGISVGWTWGHSNQTATVDNRIEFNHVHHINTERTFSDLGAIYTLGLQPGGTIRQNHLHDLWSYGYGGEGIYLDEGSSGFLVENNCAHHVQHAGISGDQRDVIIRNNVFGWCKEVQIAPEVHGGRHFASIFEHNIVAWNESTVGTMAPFAWDPYTLKAHGNVFWSYDIPLKLTDGNSIEYWNRRGQLLDTLVADPLLLDPDGGDFRIRADSPAIPHGFDPFDPSEAGDRLGKVRPASYDEWLAIHGDDIADKPILSLRMQQTGGEGERGDLTIRIANPGRLPVVASCSLRAPAGVVFKDGSRFEIPALEPGEVREVHASFHAADGTHLIELRPDDARFLSAYAIANTGGPTIRIGSAPHPASAREIPVALAHSPEHLILFDGKQIAAVRLAASADALLVCGTVVDANPRPGVPEWWDGSCFEIWAGTSPNDRTEQVVLITEPPATTMKAIRMESWFSVPRPEVESWFRRSDDGYEFAAALPYELLGLKSGIAGARFELAANVFLSPEATGSVKGTLFAAPRPQYTTRGFALAKVCSPAESEQIAR